MKADRNLRLILNKIYRGESLLRTDLRNLYFNCMNFSGLDLRETNFEGARLSRGILDSSDLTQRQLGKYRPDECHRERREFYRRKGIECGSRKLSQIQRG